MNKIKVFYYPLIAVLSILLIIFTAVGISGSKHSTNSFNNEFAETHVQQLTSYKDNSNDVKDINNFTIYDKTEIDQRSAYFNAELPKSNISMVYTNAYDSYTYNADLLDNKASFTSFRTINVTSSDRSEWQVELSGEIKDEAYAPLTLTNRIVYLPGKNYASGNRKVILFVTHFDSSSTGIERGSNAVNLGTMLEVIVSLRDTVKTYENDVAFLFTEGAVEDHIGMKVMQDKFIGFKNMMSNIGVVINFDSRGTKGSTVAFFDGDKNSEMTKLISKIGGASIYSSALVGNTNYLGMTDTYLAKKNGIPYVNFANVGGKTAFATQNDTEVNKKMITTNGNIMMSLANKLGNMDLDKLKSDTGNMYFNYLGLKIVLPNATAYVFAAIILILLALIVFLNQSKKVFDWMNILKGLAVQVIALLTAAGVGYLLFYGVTSVLAIFNVISIYAVPKLMFSSIPLLITVSIFVAVFSTASYIVFKRIFRVKAHDVVRANILLLGVAAAVLCFAAPAISYLLSIFALLETAALLFIVLTKNNFRDKYGFDIERFFIAAIPMILMLPISYGTFLILGDLLGAFWYPLIMLIPVFLLGFIAPYFDYLKPLLSKVASKIPLPAQRVQYTVTKKVEDPAKKGKFTEVTAKEIRKEQRQYNYRNWHLLTVIAAVMLIMIFCFSAVGANFSVNSTAANTDRYYTDDAFIYVIDKRADAPVASHYYKVADLDAYSYISKAVTGMSWDSDVNAYVKEDELVISSTDAGKVPRAEKLNRAVEREVSFDFYCDWKEMIYDLSFTLASTIDKIVIGKITNTVDGVTTSVDGTGIMNNIGTFESETTFRVNESATEAQRAGKSTFTIKGLRGKFNIKIYTYSANYAGTMKFAGKSVHPVRSLASSGVNVSPLQNLDEWRKLTEHYNTGKDADMFVFNRLKSGMEIYADFNVNTL